MIAAHCAIARQRQCLHVTKPAPIPSSILLSFQFNYTLFPITLLSHTQSKENNVGWTYIGQWKWGISGRMKVRVC